MVVYNEINRGEFRNMAKASFSKIVQKLFKQLGILGYGKKKNLHGINPLIISTFFIVLTVLLASFARKLVRRVYGEKESIVKNLILEFVATFELCACCFELIIVADNWGVSAYAVYLFLLTIWWSSIWDTASACPYCPIEEVVEGFKSWKTAILLVVSQLLAAVITFRYVQIIWAFELVETHRGKAFEECTADLQVDVIFGAIVEASLTCLCRLVSRTLGETETRFAGYLDAFFGTMMVVLAFNFSGGYFNPALATSLKYGCKGNTFVEHMVVYWMGSFVGSLGSVFLFRTQTVQNFVKRMKPKTE